MPKIAKELSALEIRRLEKPGLHAVGGVVGLYLQVTSAGARTWILRAMIGGRRRDFGLGSFPTITLALARDQARETRVKIMNGIDPVEERRKARAKLAIEASKAITFDEAAHRFLALKTSEFRNAKHAAQWTSTLSTYASPFFGDKIVGEVGLTDILEALRPIWQTKTETATRVRGRIEAVLNWAIVSGYRDGDNPARWRGNLDAILPKPSKIAKVIHHRALPASDMPAFMTELRMRPATAARALEFAVLTATRSGEVRGATWDEVDIQEALWSIPGSRMKAGKEHRVPLSQAALAILQDMDPGEGTIFQAPKGGELSDMALSQLLRRMKVDAVPHGFRSTFRDWVSEQTGYSRELAEAALAHQIENKVEAAYRRGDLLEKRRAMMEDWAGWCETEENSVSVR